MSQYDAQQKFKSATTLYKQEKYELALELFEELNDEFPSSEKIFLARARCPCGSEEGLATV